MGYLSGWNTRKEITLTGGSSGAQTDYQLKLAITHATGMAADFSDLRFTKFDGTTLIDAWLESKVDSTSAVVWVEFPTTPVDGSTESYYMYYNNSTASTNWNGANTFLKFDDFESGLSGWSGQTTQYTTSTNTAFDGTHSLYKSGADGHDNRLYQAETTADLEVSMRARNSDSLDMRGGTYIGVSGDNDHYYNAYVDPGNNISLREFDNGAYVTTLATGTISAIATTQWIEVKIRKTGSTVDIFAYSESGALLGSITGTTLTFSTGYVGLHIYDQSSYNDQFIVRKYATNPATSAFGAAEEYGVASHGAGSRIRIRTIAPVRPNTVRYI